MKILLLIHIFISILALIKVYSIGFQSARELKRIGFKPKYKISFVEKVLNIFSTWFQALCPIWNILVLIGMLITREEELVEKIVQKFMKDRG